MKIFILVLSIFLLFPSPAKGIEVKDVKEDLEKIGVEEEYRENIETYLNLNISKEDINNIMEEAKEVIGSIQDKNSISDFSFSEIFGLYKKTKGVAKDLNLDFGFSIANKSFTLKDKKKPEVLTLKNGKGKVLKETIEEIKKSYLNSVRSFYNGSSDLEKDLIIEKIHEKRTSYIEELVILSKDEGFHIKPTNGGFAFFPLKEEGEIMTEKEYEDLTENNKESIMAKASYLKEKAERVLEKLRVMELDAMKELKIIYSKFLSQDMELKKEEYLLKFIAEDRVYEYLEMLFIEIEKGLIECYNINIEEDEEKIQKVYKNEKKL